MIVLCLAGCLGQGQVVAQNETGRDESASKMERGGRSDRGMQIDPTTDEVLLTMKAAVSPTNKQMERFVHLYTQLRQDQRDAMRRVFQEMRGDRGGRGGRAEMMQKIHTQLEPINEKFMSECRAALDPGQHEGWDDCAAQLDLMPRRGNARRGIGPSNGLSEGDTAPPFELVDLNGDTVTLQSLRGRPIVLEFGSYTCPAFRRQVDAIETVRADYADDVHWVLVYTREAHASDGWVSPANTRSGIEIPQHTLMSQRIECARLCNDKLDLALLVLVDDMANKVAEAYGGFPNRGFVIDAEGKIVSKQPWIEPDQTREALKKLLKPSMSSAESG